MKNFLRNIIRTVKSHRGYVFLNMGGLAAGIASFLLITLYVLHEISYDRFHKNYQNIYRVKAVGRMAGSTMDHAITCAPLAATLVKDYPEIITSTRLLRMGAWLIQSGDNRFNENGILFADSTFFNVFSFRLVKGDPGSALVKPRSMVLTEEYAKKYFGDKDPVGQKLIVEADTILYTVTGVVQNVPDNSHVQFDILASISSYPRMANDQFWVNHNFYTYFVARSGTSKDILEKKLSYLVTNYVGPQIKEELGISLDEFRKSGNDYGYRLEPLKDIHFKGATQYNLEPPGSRTTVYIFAIIAILILVIAVINYINLATARSVNRAKEVGVRKVAGGSKTGLISQFLGESILISGCAVLLAVILVFALMPSFNHLIGKDLAAGTVNSLSGILLLMALIIVVGISAGFYPAFILASFNPVDVLKGTLSPASISKSMRAVLVVFQFTVSIVIIIGSIIVYNQLNHMTRKDLGFKKRNLIIIQRPDVFHARFEAFRDQLLKLPGVEAVGFSRAVPGTTYNNRAFFRDEDPEKNPCLLNHTQVSFDFPQALGVQLADGRFFSREFGGDSLAVMINEAAVKSLGLKNPVGQYILEPTGPKEFLKHKVIGVMKDFNIESMHKAITPVIFTVLTEGGGDQYATVRLKGENVALTIREIREIWQRFTARQPFQYDFFSDSWDRLYFAELRTGKIFIIFSVLAVLIACLGLIGLITYITGKRTREIGIRKAHGASIGIVLGILSKEVLYLILISSVIAWPLAYLGSEYWLEGFADKIWINPVIFLLATIIALIIGWISISFQTIKAAGYSPAEALKINN
jgi:putative ABC transport system permease protein